MSKYIKVLGLVLALLMIFSSAAFAAGTDEFTKDDDSAINNSALTDTIQPIVTSDTDTLDSTVNLIQSEPDEDSNYDRAADLFTSKGDKDIKIFLDGILMDFSKYDHVQPVIKSGKTLVPLAAIAEGLGAGISYNAGLRQITLTLEDKTMKLTLDSKAASLDGRRITLDVAATVTNGRTLVPLSFIAQNFGKTVKWHPYKKGDGAKIIAIY